MKSFIRGSAWAVLCLVGASAGARPMPQDGRPGIDASSQYRLYLKVLAFDRNFTARVGDGLIIGVFFAGAVKESRQAMDDFARAVAEGPADFEGLPVRLVPIKYGKAAEIETGLIEGSVDVLYVTPLGPNDVNGVSAVCRARKVPTFTGVPEYVERGLSVSFGLSGRKAEVLINLGSSRAEGSDFSARLLDMVTVVDAASCGKGA